MRQLTLLELLAGLKASGELTRLRILILLADGELNVKDLTRILGQSQPRISRHLKLLSDAGLIERFREGSWVYFRLAEDNLTAIIVTKVLAGLDMEDSTIRRDRERAAGVKMERAVLAQKYFREHVGEWDRIRSLHVAEDDVETAMLKVMGPGPFEFLVDAGTGTGRILELFSEHMDRGLGVDINHDMLAYARVKLERSEVSNCQVRHGDLFNLPLDDATADAVVIHQVLHFLDDPAQAIKEAGRILRPNGKLLVVDFAPHNLEFLRDEFAHQRLGFENRLVSQWIKDAGLNPGVHRNLKPDSKTNEEKLTVSIWRGSKSLKQDKIRKSIEKNSLEVISS